MNSSYLAASQFKVCLSAEIGKFLEYYGQDPNITLNAYTSYHSTTAVATIATSNSTSVAAPTCTGQVVTAAKVKQRQLLSGFSAYGNITAQCKTFLSSTTCQLVLSSFLQETAIVIRRFNVLATSLRASANRAGQRHVCFRGE